MAWQKLYHTLCASNRGCPRELLCGVVVEPQQQAFRAQVLVDVRPVDAISTACNLPVVELFRSGVEELGVPGERHTDNSAVL
jgi:hypothetical protein